MAWLCDRCGAFATGHLKELFLTESRWCEECGVPQKKMETAVGRDLGHFRPHRGRGDKQFDGAYHSPEWRYDCDRCKFGWCCGPTCHCRIHDRPDPPEERKHEVDKALRDAGYVPQFYGEGAQRR